MRKLSLLLVTALAVCVNALAANTTVVDTVYLASGAPAGGTISVLPNTQFVTNDGTYVALQAKVFTLATGKVTMSLVPNVDAAPAYGNTYYRATYHLSDGSSYTETWVVPHSLVTLRIRDLMSNILSPGQAASVFVSPQQITQSGANSGDALVWNGAKNQYIPTPVGNTAVNSVTGIVKMDGAGGASAASLSDIEALGLGNIVTHNVNEFDIAGAAATALASAQSSSLQKSANLSDVGSIPTTLSNLGIRSAAQHDAADFDSAGAAAAVQSAISGASLAKSANLSDIPSAPTARANLGLGDSATHGFSEFDRAGTATSAIAALNLGSAANHAASDFDPAGAANAAQTAAVTASDPAGAAAAAQAASDPNGAAASAVRGLNLKSAAQHDATDFDPAGAAMTAQAAAQAASDPLGAAATAQSNAIAASDPRGAAAAAQSAAQAASDPLGTATSQIAALSLGTAAQHPASDFDPAGAAAAVQSAAQAASDPAGTAAAQIAALNLKSASQHAVSDFDPSGAADTAQANAIAASDARGAATAAQAAAITASLQKAANLSDLANLATARTNLGLGDAAIHNAADFDAAGSASTAQAAAQASSLQKSANLSDVANAGTSRANLGLGTVATHNVQEFDMAGAAAAASVIAQSTSLQDANNLSDLSSPAAARGHLGLGDIATHSVADFDATGSAAAAQVAAQGSSLQKSANLSDLNSALTSRTNLGLGSSATHPATDFEPIGAAAAATAAAQASSAQKAANLGDLPSPSTARTNLGLPADSTLDFANAANITTGTLPAGRLPASAVQTTTDSTYGAVTVDASGTAHSLPTKTGLTANKPATCKIGEVYFATDAQAGLNFLYCGATNVWTSQTAAIAGSGTGLVPSNNLSDLTSVATARNNLQLGTASLQPSTAFLGTANNLSDIPNPALARTNLGLPSTFIDTTVASNITSGTLPAGRLPALVGDVTLPVGTNTTTVAAVGGQSATNVANASAAWAAANTANNPLKLDINGFTPAAQTGALSGDVTKPAGSASTTIANVGGQSATNVAQVSSAWQTPNTANSPLKLDINGRIPYAQLPAITGDVTSLAGGGTTTIQLVGGQSAANVAAASTAWQGRNTASGPLQLDAGGHVAAAQGETLTGDVTKTAGVSTTSVANVGGQSAANVAAVSTSFQAANTANNVVKTDGSNHISSAQMNFNQGVTGAGDRTLQDKTKERVSVRDFTCFADGVTDDSPCFIRAMAYIQSAGRAAPGGGPQLGSVKLVVPHGTYMIKAPILVSSFSTRTVGLVIEGDGIGISTVIYQPTTAGALFTNNDAFLFVRMSHLSFQMNDAGSDFMDSISTGGAQNYSFEDVGWSGAYRYGFNLTGTNNNSEMLWHKCSISSTNSASIFFYIGGSGTSDQFLNYVFDDNSVDLSAGNFMDASKGGHFKVTHNDFSGLNGSGNPAAPNIIFSLRGSSHAYGVNTFIASGNRFELRNNSVSVLYSEWGSYGQVTFEDNDYSSQVQNYPASTVAFNINLAGASGGAQYNFSREHIIGSVNISTGNSDWGYRRSITFSDTQFLSFEDYSQAFTWNVAAGSNLGGLPVIQCSRCRGLDSLPTAAVAWTTGVTYAANATVSSHGYNYITSAGGVAGATAPSGRSASYNDGGVTWTTVDTYPGASYATEALIRYPGAGSSLVNGLSSRLSVVAVSDPFNLNKLPVFTNQVGGYEVAILPPNAVIYRIQFVVTPGGNSQGTPGTFTARTNNYSPNVFFSTTLSKLSDGGSYDYTPPIPYSVGTDIGSRSIVLDPSVNVTQSAQGYFLVWYL